MSRWLRAPLLHFVLLGGALFVLDGWRRPAASRVPVPRAVVISAARVRELRDEFTRTTGLAVSPDDDRALVAHAVDEELLYREALARGLDQDDRSIRWQLIEKMRFLAGAEHGGDDGALLARARSLGLDRDDPVIRRMLIEKVRLLEKASAADAPIADAELQAYLTQHVDQYRQPARVSLWQVFLARSAGRAVDADAHRLLARLRAEHLPAVQAVAFGDGFPLASHLRAQSERQLAAVFGETFAGAVMAATPGDWIGPIASAHGLHLVQIEAVEPGAPASLADVRPQVTDALRRERAAARLTALVERLRAGTAVEVDWPTQEGS